MSAWNIAVVTGASAGIGEAIVRRLADAGTRPVLVARRGDRLHALAGELPVEAEVLVADLADTNGRKRVADRLRSDADPIDLLVNNAGFGVLGLFPEVEYQQIQAQMDVLVTAVVELTHAAVPGMIERGRGGVLNISSLAANFPFPGSGIYNASKAFVTSLSESLHAELAGTGVVVTASEPGFVRTEFQTTAGTQEKVGDIPDWMWLDADRVAVDSLAALNAGDVVHRSALVYRTAAAAANGLPRPVVRWMTSRAGRRAGLTRH